MFGKSVGKLLSRETTKHNGKRLFCLRCLNSFASDGPLKKHLELCQTKEPVNIQFKNYNRKMRVLLSFYGDFESFLLKLGNQEPTNKEESYTHKTAIHKPSGYGLYTKCFDDKVYSPKMKVYTKLHQVMTLSVILS